MIRLSNFEKLLCRPLVLSAFSFILGILCCGKGKVFLILTLFPAGLLLVCSHIREKKKIDTGSIYYLAVWLIIPFFFYAGCARTAEKNVPSELKAETERSHDAEVMGIISDISIKSEGCVLTLDQVSVRIGQKDLKSEKINIVTSERKDFYIGEAITALGKLRPYEKATNPGQFDSELYYRIRGIDAVMYTDDVADPNLVPDENGTRMLYEESGKESFSPAGNTPLRIKYAFLNMLYKARMSLTEGLYEVLPEKEAGILTCMLTGERGLLDTEIKELYSDGGIAHILSISGLHITLLGMGFFRFLMFTVKRLKPGCVLTIIMVLAYGFMTGFSVSTRRAVLMIVIAMAGRLAGKAYDRMNACGAASLMILFIQPLYIYDTGFKLSFLAVIGINIMLYAVDALKIENKILKAVLPGVSVWLFTLPVIMEAYCEITPYALLINPLILIFMSMLLVSGFFCGISFCLGGVFIAKLFGGPVYFILKLYELLCRYEMRLPLAKVVTGAPGRIFMILYYSVLLAVLTVVIRKKLRIALTGLVMCGCIFINYPGKGLQAYFIDVGQGDGALVRCEGINILIDGGSSSVSSVGKKRMIPFLKYLGINYVDVIMISHSDSDHVSGILEMIEEGYPRIGRIVTGYVERKDNMVVAAALEKGIPVEYVAAKDTVITGKEDMFSVTVVAPEPGAVYSDKNSASVVALFSYGDASMLFTGDSGFESEKMYMPRIRGKGIFLLKTAHHGSRYSTSEAVLEAADPVISVISCSKYNSYHHPAPETLKRLEEAGSRVFVTCDQGMVSVSYGGGDRCSVRTFKDSRIE